MDLLKINQDGLNKTIRLRAKEIIESELSNSEAEIKQAVDIALKRILEGISGCQNLEELKKMTTSDYTGGDKIEECMFRITKTISDYMDLDYEMLFTKTRKREYITVKHLAMHFMCKKLPKLASQERVRIFFKAQKHCTVVHANKSVMDQCDTDEAYRELYNKLDSLIDSTIKI